MQRSRLQSDVCDVSLIICFFVVKIHLNMTVRMTMAVWKTWGRGWKKCGKKTEQKVSTPPSGSACFKKILQGLFAENCDVDDHPSPDLNADMSEFDGDVTDVDVGKHCQEV